MYAESLMTSRELTFGFAFSSRDHLHFAVVHLSIKFGGLEISSSDPEILKFFEIQYGGLQQREIAYGLCQ